MNELVPSDIQSSRRALRAACFLLAVECVMLAYPCHGWLVSGSLMLWAASRWWTLPTGWSLQLPVLWNSLPFAMAFTLKYVFFPATFPTDAGFANTELAHEIGCFLVVYQILILHETNSLNRIAPRFAVLGCAVALCAADLQLHSVSRNVMLALMVLFVGGLGWLAHAGRIWLRSDERRRWRRGVILATLMLAIVPTVLASQAWHRHERDLEACLLQMMRYLEGDHRPQSNYIRSPLVQVSNGKIHAPESPVLKVTQSSQEPLYLRGVAFDLQPSQDFKHAHRFQFDDLPKRLPNPGEGLPSDRSLFEVYPHTEPPWGTVQVEYLSKDDPVLLSPLNTALIDIQVSNIRRDPLMNLSLIEEELPNSFTCYLSSTLERSEPPEKDSSVRRFGNPLDPRVQALADSLFQDAEHDSEKMEAVTRFFHENFHYELGFEPPRREDPITFFLLRRPSAHCEYFAAGAAILLRAGGVPTRYITGYVPSEKHTDGSWIARRKDAHAWVEAYDSERRSWVTVEPTPSVGRPEQRRASWMESMSESLRKWRNSINNQLQEWSLVNWISTILKSSWIRGLLALGMISIWWLFSRRTASVRRTSKLPETRCDFPLRRRLDELESDLARHGLARRPDETLLQFRERILSSPQKENFLPAANWYAHYSTCRYNEKYLTPDSITLLETEWATVQSCLFQTPIRSP